MFVERADFRLTYAGDGRRAVVCGLAIPENLIVGNGDLGLFSLFLVSRGLFITD